MLSKKQLADICMSNQGHQACRYLSQDELDWSKFHCIKLRPIEKSKIDKKVSDYISECKRKGTDPNKQSIPIADNCSGYPLLKTINQGYDCP